MTKQSQKENFRLNFTKKRKKNILDKQTQQNTKWTKPRKVKEKLAKSSCTHKLIEKRWQKEKILATDCIKASIIIYLTYISGESVIGDGEWCQNKFIY